MTFTVTQHHIDDGTICDGAGCPIALAAFDSGPDVLAVSVSTTVIMTFSGDLLSRSYALPSAARVWMAIYDAGNGGDPFSFDAAEL